MSAPRREHRGQVRRRNVASHSFALAPKRLRTEAAPDSRVNPAYLRGARRCRVCCFPPHPCDHMLPAGHAAQDFEMRHETEPLVLPGRSC
jgi:hypothetical protein